MNYLECRGAIFDLDEVITQTALIHFKAWKKVFDEFLFKKSEIEDEEFVPFIYEDDYIPFIDGVPRYQGVKKFLESRDVDIPYGNPNDAPSRDTVCGIGNRKSETFRAIISEEGAETYQSTVKLIKDLKSNGIKVGIASSSKNCKFILEKTGLSHLFETVVGGIVATELGLAGKPSPEILLAAVKNMNLNPNECLMVEGATPGIGAGRDGNFALVIGVARGDDKESLKAHGADLVVNDLKEITIERIKKWFKDDIKKEAWHLTYYGFESDQEKLRETLTTVGNGYYGTRGCFECKSADEIIHYPGTYIAGVYNKLPSVIFRKTIYNNDFVNCPNWLLIELKIGDSEYINPLQMELIYYKHDLNMKDAVVSREIVFKDKKGRTTSIKSKRIASMDNPHYGAIKFDIIPKNYSEKITIKSTLDGDISNYGVPRYRELNSKHLAPISVGRENGQIYLHMQTNVSKVRIYLTAKHFIYADKTFMTPQKKLLKDTGRVSEIISLDAEKGHVYSIEKLVSIYTSNDTEIEDVEETSSNAFSEVNSFKNLYSNHKKQWSKLWDIADFKITGDRFAQRVIRLHIYHLLASASLFNKNIDAGMTARGLHGEAYRGHVFWDELFVFPFFNLHFPDITKALLMYRYRRLDGARNYAREAGYKGAMYPWQTADGGGEETQILHFNPVSGKWDPDLSCLQRHVSIAIAYNIWQYYFSTNDQDFLYDFGAEMMIEISRFWSSIAEYSKEDERYHIRGIMGPDEFHEKYHNSDKGGVDDNAFTNIMVSWLLHKTIEMVEELPVEVVERLKEKIFFNLDEVEKWGDVVEKMAVFISSDGIISQFDGYLDLQELNWDFYRRKHDGVRRMDRILKSKGDSPDRFQVSKQADVLMTFYVLSPKQVKHILEMMGYEVGDAVRFMKKNYEYYIRRTSHGSTLSYVVHSAILKYVRSQKKDMWKWYFNALKSDIFDMQGGTTTEGIHTGVMAGTVDIIVRSFAGINIYKDRVELNPNVPRHWNNLSFKIVDRGNLFSFEISKNNISLKCDLKHKKEIRVVVGKDNYKLKSNKVLNIPYKRSV